MLIDHRGVGRSSRLNCENEVQGIKNLKECLKYLTSPPWSKKKLFAFSVSNAAKDLLYWIKLNKKIENINFNSVYGNFFLIFKF
jgi:hypothetical protein